MPWQHRQGRSLDDGRKGCKGDALRENGPFFYSKSRRRLRDGAQGWEKAKEDRLSIKSMRRCQGTVQVHACRPLLVLLDLNGPPQTDGLTGAENFVLPSLHLPAYSTAEETTRTTIDPTIPTTATLATEERLNKSILERLSVLQASACVWVAAELLASLMHDAGKRWGTIHLAGNWGLGPCHESRRRSDQL